MQLGHYGNSNNRAAQRVAAKDELASDWLPRFPAGHPKCHGIFNFSPSLSLSLDSPLADLILSTVVPFFRAMPQSVSPATTTCVPPELFEAAGFGLGFEELAVLEVVLLGFGLDDDVLATGFDELGLLLVEVVFGFGLLTGSRSTGFS